MIRMLLDPVEMLAAMLQAMLTREVYRTHYGVPMPGYYLKEGDPRRRRSIAYWRQRRSALRLDC